MLGGVILPMLSWSQTKLMVLGRCPDCYVQYKPKVGENIEQVAALAALTPEKLLAFNGLKQGVQQSMPSYWRLPISSNNLQKKSGGIPVYHVVDKGDNLYRINLLYFQPGIEQLQEWNGLKTNAVKDGGMLLIGYLFPTAPSIETSVTESVIPVTASSTQSLVSNNDTAQLIREGKITAGPEEGYFYDAFNASVIGRRWQEKMGLCGTFKSISGWSDQRYYVLINDVEVGTIIRISAGGNNFVCARVLGSMPDIKANKGLLMRLSNAAAEKLGMNDQSFFATIQYKLSTTQ
jgi:hypothetical protein